MQDPQNIDAKKTKLLKVCLLFIVGLCLSFLFRYKSTVRNAEQEMQFIRLDYVTVSPLSPSPSPNPQPDDILAKFQVPELEIDFEALQKDVNSDIYSWILIPDTSIDYPVVQHPDDNTYYLNHNLDGSSGYPGCIYTENYNSKEWDDVNTILYGHNMRNGSMFAGLHAFKDEDFFESHPYIYLYSPDTIRVYQIFAAYEFSDLHLLAACNWNDPEDVLRFFSKIPEYPGVFDETVELSGDAGYLTLSTCSSGRSDKRVLVQAVLMAQVSL